MENAWAATSMTISRISRVGHVKKRYRMSWSHDCHINNVEPENRVMFARIEVNMSCCFQYSGFILVA